MRGFPRQISPLALALALGALLLAACGGDDDRDKKNAYVREVNAAQTQFATTVTTVSQEITPKSSSSEDRRALQRFETAIADVVTKLRAIKVPSEVRVEHKQLVDAMRGFGAQINQASAALRNTNARKIAEAQRDIATATQTVNVRIDAAIAAINSKLAAT